MKASQKKLSMIFSIALIMSIAMINTAYAIKYGQPDGNGHPYVCYIATWNGTAPYCYIGTGALIAQNVVLTAGHITNDFDGTTITEAYVSFAPTASWPPPFWGGTGSDWIEVLVLRTHPDYTIGEGTKGLTDWITHDVGVLILPDVEGITPADLPEAYYIVDDLPMMTDVDLVGYGVQYHQRGGGFIDWDTRYYAPAQLIASEHVLSDEFIRLTANPGRGKGSTCFGDSGSPILLAGTNDILGVCSWGANGNCAGVSYEQRIDLPVILDWIIARIDQYS